MNDEQKMDMKQKNDNNIQQRQNVIIRKDGSRRVTLDVSYPIETDQSMKKATDINNILKQYSSAGAMPQPIQDPSYYRDNTNIPSIETAFEIVNKASEAFYTLPADVRKLMDNDPSNLESYIQDPKNRDYLISKGVLSPPPAQVDPIKEVKPEASSKQTPKES